MPESPEQPKTLSEALSVLQGRLPRVAKEHTATVTSQRTGRTHSYDYADLLAVTEAVMPLLAGLGLSFTCCPTVLEDSGRFVLDYSLHHVSDERTVGGFYPLPSAGTPQEIGSAITYARRYALCAVTGLAPGGDDDDAASAEQAAQQLPRTGTNASLREAGRMDRQQKHDHEQLAADTLRMGRAERSHPRGPDPDDPWAQDRPVDGERAAALRGQLEDRAPEDRPGSSDARQWRALGILYAELGIGERDTRLAEMTDRVGRQIGSAKDLSYTEAEAAIRELTPLAEAAKKATTEAGV